MASLQTLTKSRKKRRVHLPDEPPFPIPIETLTNKPASNSHWFYYRAKMINDHVIVQNEGDILFLHKMGFFGKGILSRSRPEHQFFASSFQGIQRKNLPPQERRFQQQRFQQIRQHKYERHLSWKKLLSNQRKNKSDQGGQKEGGKDVQLSPTYKLPAIPVKRVKRATISKRNERAGIINVDRKKDKVDNVEDRSQAPAAVNNIPEGIREEERVTYSDSCVGTDPAARKNDIQMERAGVHRKQESAPSSRAWLENTGLVTMSEQLANCHPSRLLMREDDEFKVNVFHPEVGPTRSDSAAQYAGGELSRWSSEVCASQNLKDFHQEKKLAFKTTPGSSWETREEDWSEVCNVKEWTKADESSKAETSWTTDLKDWVQPKESGPKTVVESVGDSERLLGSPSPRRHSSDNSKLDAQSSDATNKSTDYVTHPVEASKSFSSSCTSSSLAAKMSTEDDGDEGKQQLHGQRQFWTEVWASPCKDSSYIEEKVPHVGEVTGSDFLIGSPPGPDQKWISNREQDLPQMDEKPERQDEDFHLNNDPADFILPSPSQGEGGNPKQDAPEHYPQGHFERHPYGRDSTQNDEHLMKVEMLEGQERLPDSEGVDTHGADISSEEETEGHNITERDYEYLDGSRGNPDEVLVAVPTPVEFENATTSQTESNNLLCLKGRNVRKKAHSRDVKQRDTKVRDVKGPVRREDPYPIFEYLQLSYEEAFFLSYGLGCLKLEDPHKKPLNLTEMWRAFRHVQPSFVSNYIAYHFFRSKGWVPKTGLKFGADFILYKKGPPFYHASYCVYVSMLNEEDIVEQGGFNKMTWASLMGMDRVIENAAKELMFCFVIKPRSLSKRDLDSPACIPRFKVQEILMKRWVPSRERQQTNDVNVEVS